MPHFYDKHLQETVLVKEQIPYISVAAPIFVDQEPKNDFNASLLGSNQIAAIVDTNGALLSSPPPLPLSFTSPLSPLFQTFPSYLSPF